MIVHETENPGWNMKCAVTTAMTIAGTVTSSQTVQSANRKFLRLTGSDLMKSMYPATRAVAFCMGTTTSAVMIRTIVGAPVARYSISFPADEEGTRNENPMTTPSAMTVKNMP